MNRHTYVGTIVLGCVTARGSMRDGAAVSVHMSVLLRAAANRFATRASVGMSRFSFRGPKPGKPALSAYLSKCTTFSMARACVGEVPCRLPCASAWVIFCGELPQAPPYSTVESLYGVQGATRLDG
jgi:hypothetical protein